MIKNVDDISLFYAILFFFYIFFLSSSLDNLSFLLTSVYVVKVRFTSFM